MCRKAHGRQAQRESPTFGKFRYFIKGQCSVSLSSLRPIILLCPLLVNLSQDPPLGCAWTQLLFSHSVYPTLCDPMGWSTPGLPVQHQLLELAQTHVHWVNDVIQPSSPLSFPSPPALNLSQHHSLFQWVSSSHQVAKVLELQPQHQSLQWIFSIDFLLDWLVWFPCSSRDSSPIP